MFDDWQEYGEIQEIPPEIHEFDESIGEEFLNDFKGSIDFSTDTLEELENLNDHTKRAVGITSEFFTDDLIREWPSIGTEQRREYLTAYGENLLQQFAIQDVSIRFEEMEANQRGYQGGGEIVLNTDCLSDPRRLKGAIETMAHECEHAFQEEAIKYPEAYEISSELAALWKRDKKHYCDGEYDFQPYFQQSIELDARMAGKAALATLGG